MKKYRIKVLMNGGSTAYLAIDYIIEGELASIGSTYYRFRDNEGKESYYPIANTIIEEQ